MTMKQIEIMKRMAEADQAGDKPLAAAYAAMGEARLELKTVLTQLEREARIAAERCEKLARQAESCDPDADEPLSAMCWNRLGVLHGQGSEIDRLCGEAVRLGHTIAAMGAILAAIEKAR